MKKNLPVTQQELPFPEGAEIVSATDLKGVITDCNQAFIDISGFGREELIGSSHNIVRHPDVPPAVFANMWETLKAGKPWMGIVKNRCKNGDHYWVDAYVTPVLENGAVTGYESVRVKPSRDRVEAAEKLYQDVANNRRLTSFFSMNTINNLLLGSTVSITAFMVFMLVLLPGKWPWIMSAWLVALAVSLGNIFWSTRKMKKASEEAHLIINNPILEKLYLDEINDIASIRLSGVMQKSHLRTAMGRVLNMAGRVNRHANVAADIAAQANSHVLQQQSETSTVATAMEQMSVSIGEVAESAAEASASVERAAEMAQRGKLVLESASCSVGELDNIMHNTAEVVNELNNDAVAIGSVTDVIQNIAEQTNLLALNAAIEAARAGEQGRGFAVVADEVRSLATRTGESTQEIRNLIETLQNRVTQVVNVINEGKEKAQVSSSDSVELQSDLIAVLDIVEEIKGKNFVIATAVEQQSGVSREMAQNIQNINNLSHMAADAVHKVATETSELNQLASDMENMVVRFRS